MGKDLRGIFKTGEITIGEIKQFFEMQICIGEKEENTLGYFTDSFTLRLLYRQCLELEKKRMMEYVTERSNEINDLGGLLCGTHQF